MGALSLSCLLAPFVLFSCASGGRRARRRRRYVAALSAFFIPLMAISPSHVEAMNNSAVEYYLDGDKAAPMTPTVTTYAYDANGNMVTKTTTENDETSTTISYTYDAANRLITVDNGDVSDLVSYTYDDDGIRTSKRVGTSLTTFVTDKNRDYAQVLEERVSGSVTKRYVYGHDLVSQTTISAKSESTLYFHYDGQLSTRNLSDAGGNVQTEAYTFDAFGNLINGSAATLTDYLYTGEQYDANVGFYYLRARYYNPNIGRFFTRDTYEGSQYDPMSLHKYLYCHANPISCVDPSGLFSMPNLVITMSIGATIGGITLGVIGGVYGYRSGGVLGAIKYAAIGLVIGVLVGSLLGALVWTIASAGLSTAARVVWQGIKRISNLQRIGIPHAKTASAAGVGFFIGFLCGLLDSNYTSWVKASGVDFVLSTAVVVITEGIQSVFTKYSSNAASYQIVVLASMMKWIDKAKYGFGGSAFVAAGFFAGFFAGVLAGRAVREIFVGDDALYRLVKSYE